MASAGRIKRATSPAKARRLAGLRGGEQAAPPLERVAGALLVTSAGSLAFEVLLTRLFSLVFQYHFAFLAISLAVLGLGVGALLAAAVGASRAVQSATQWMPRFLLLFALSLPLAALAFSQLPSAGLVLAAILFGLLPFAMAGGFSATVYALHSQGSARLYAVDLLGAALGLALSQLLTGWLGAFNAAFLLGAAAALAALLLAASRQQRTASLALAGIAILGLLANLQFKLLDLPLSLQDAPPDKVMYHVLADPSQQARVIDTLWSPFARVDLVQTSDPDQMFVFTDAGAGSFMVHFTGDLAPVSWLQTQVGYLPFTAGPTGRTLILGAGAGKDVLQALLAGSQDITAVEINPSMVAMTRRHANYNGGIFDRPGVHTVVGDGRNFIARSQDQYDLIYLNLVYSQASAPGSAALTESYIFTEEAFRLYWQHLAPGGRLAIVSHQALEGSRALITAIGALRLEGLKSSEVLQRSALFMLPNDDPNQRQSVMVLRKQPWTPEEIQSLNQQAASRGMQALFAPGIFEATMNGLTNDAIPVEKFVSGDQYNLLPTRDDRPFFFNLAPGVPATLVTLLWLVVAAAAIYLGLLLALNLAGTGNPRLAPAAWQVGYFGLIGAGFMLIEVPLIQRFILLLGSPSLSLVTVLGALLLSAGAGSLLSGRVPVERLLPVVAAAGILAAGLAALGAFTLPALVQALLPAGIAGRLLAAGLAILPVGLVLGVPFSSGLRLAGASQPATGVTSAATNYGGIALLWGWNAIAGVAGSVLATVLAVLYGFTWVLVAGAACYLALAALAALRSWRRSG